MHRHPCTAPNHKYSNWVTARPVRQHRFQVQKASDIMIVGRV